MTSRKFLLSLALFLTTILTLQNIAAAQSTAQSGFTEVLTIAQAEAPDAALLGLIGDAVSPTTGASTGWFYVFESAQNENIFAIIRSGEDVSEIVPLSEFPPEVADMITPGEIPSTWLDSDLALSVAEANGGAEFRSTYPDANITATLLGIPSTEMLDLDLPPIPALWMFTYSSLDDQSAAASIHIVDALFGFHIELEPSTARQNLDVAGEAAMDYSADAQLISVSTLLPDFDSNGLASIWMYTYYSESLQDGVMVFASSGLALGSTPLLADPVSTQPLPDDWFDSPIAVTDIETPLSDVILSPSLVQARVSKGLSDEQPEFAFWELNYLLFEEGFLENFIENPNIEDLDALSIESILINAEDIPVTPPSPESAFRLINALTDQPIENYAPIVQGAILDLSLLPEQLNIDVAFDVQVDFVQFELNGTVVNTERVAPYALFGDNQGDYNAGPLPIQKHVLKATPTIDGTPGEAVEVMFEVVNSQVPVISSLVIVDADTDIELFEFNDGAALSISDLPANVNIAAKINTQVKSVLFDLNQGFYQRLENVPPFAFFGDTNGDFLPGTLPVGGHELKVTPYSDIMKGGEKGPEFVIRFTILNETGSNKSNLQNGYFVEPLNSLSEDVPQTFALHNNYPNPFNPSTTISFELPEASRVQIKVFDTLGRLVSTLTDGTYEAGQHAVRFEASQLTSGLYIYQLVTPETVISKKMTFLK